MHRLQQKSGDRRGEQLIIKCQVNFALFCIFGSVSNFIMAFFFADLMENSPANDNIVFLALSTAKSLF